jgi:DNA-binding MarR family transcriptional regulator
MSRTGQLREAVVLDALERARRSGRPVSTPTIARLLRVTPGSAGDLMRRLEDQGEVVRAEPPEDALAERRTYWWTVAAASKGRCVSCTDKGEAEVDAP